MFHACRRISLPQLVIPWCLTKLWWRIDVYFLDSCGIVKTCLWDSYLYSHVSLEDASDKMMACPKTEDSGVIVCLRVEQTRKLGVWGNYICFARISERFAWLETSGQEPAFVSYKERIRKFFQRWPGAMDPIKASYCCSKFCWGCAVFCCTPCSQYWKMCLLGDGFDWSAQRAYGSKGEGLPHGVSFIDLVFNTATFFWTISKFPSLWHSF